MASTTSFFIITASTLLVIYATDLALDTCHVGWIALGVLQLLYKTSTSSYLTIGSARGEWQKASKKIFGTSVKLLASKLLRFEKASQAYLQQLDVDSQGK